MRSSKSKDTFRESHLGQRTNKTPPPPPPPPLPPSLLLYCWAVTLALSIRFGPQPTEFCARIIHHGAVLCLQDTGGRLFMLYISETPARQKEDDEQKTAPCPSAAGCATSPTMAAPGKPAACSFAVLFDQVSSKTIPQEHAHCPWQDAEGGGEHGMLEGRGWGQASSRQRRQESSGPK